MLRPAQSLMSCTRRSPGSPCSLPLRAPATGSSTPARPHTWPVTRVCSPLSLPPHASSSAMEHPCQSSSLVHHSSHRLLPLHLHDVHVSPSLIKNLVSVRKLTRDNHVSVEFDPLGFSIKDLRNKEVLLRSESSGDLYPCPCHCRSTALCMSPSTLGTLVSATRGSPPSLAFYSLLISVVLPPLHIPVLHVV